MNGIIVLLNLMSFLKPLKLENYTQIFIQLYFSFTKWPEVDTVYNKEKIRWNMPLLQPQLNENLYTKQAALPNKVYNHLSFKENLSNEEDATTMYKNF